MRMRGAELELRQDNPAQVVEVLRLAEEAGVVGGERIHHGRQRFAARVALHIGAVFLERGDRQAAHLLAQAGGDQHLLAAEVDAEVVVDHAADQLELARTDLRSRARERSEDGTHRTPPR